MRLLIATAFIAATLVGAAHADTMKHCAAAWGAMPMADKAATTYKAYSSTCLKAGYTAKMPIAGAPPAGATAKCNDGTFSMSAHHSGTCSHHGGVASWLK